VWKVIVSSHNSLGDGQYYDVESSSSFSFDHSTQVHTVKVEYGGKAANRSRKQAASKAMFWKAASQILCKSTDDSAYMRTNRSNSKSLLKSLSTHVKEHYSNASYGVYPIEDDSKIAIVVVANKYSPNNFW
jgi:capping protein alpha